MEEIKYQHFKVRRRGKKVRKGVMVACPVDDENIIIGYSMCHFSKNDTYDFFNGFDIALDRADKWWVMENETRLKPIIENNVVVGHIPTDEYLAEQVPHSIRRSLAKFINRMQRYYKDKSLPKWSKVLSSNVSLEEI